MMRGVRRLVVYTAVAGLLAAGAVSTTLEAAHADTTVTTCAGEPENSFICNLDATVGSAGTITVSANSGSAVEELDVTWTVTCTDSTGTASQEGATDNATTPFGVPLVPLPATADGQCSVNASVTLPKPDPFPKVDFEGTLSYGAGSPTTSTGGSGPPVHPIKGYGGKCVDDKGNSSADRSKIIIWTCSGTDQALSWKFSNGEFIHNGKCMNDQGNGGIHSHVILWSCNGAANEKWSELANGELMLKSHGGTLCLDDPRSSTTNGTQLILYTCKDSANQKWSLP
jgi:Ricin-type beta-trefoil lectin domain